MSDAEKKKEYYKKYREEHREELKKADRERKAKKKLELKKSAPDAELHENVLSVQCPLENNDSKTVIAVVQAHEEPSEKTIEEPSSELNIGIVCQKAPPQPPDDPIFCVVPNDVGCVSEPESDVSSTFELHVDDIQEHLFEINIREQQRIEQQRIEQQRMHNAGTACLREQQRIEQQRIEQQRIEQQRMEQQRMEQQRMEQQRIERQRIHNAGTACLREQQLIIERQHKEKMMKIFMQEQQQVEQNQIDKKQLQNSINKVLSAKQNQIQINKANYALDDELYKLKTIIASPETRLKMYRQMKEEYEKKDLSYGW